VLMKPRPAGELTLTGIPLHMEELEIHTTAGVSRHRPARRVPRDCPAALSILAWA